MRRPFGTGLLLCALACRSGGGVRADSSASPVPGRVYTGSQVKPPPAVVWVPPLRYPDTLRAHGVEGRVLVDAIIDTGGRVEPASVAIVTSPDARFDAAARETVLGMRFLPGMVRNVPVRTSVRLPVQFRLRPDADTAELPLRLTQVEEQPELVSAPAAVLPKEAAGGSVLLRFVLDTLGHPVANSFEVLDSPHPALSREAIRVTRASRYRPARLQGAARRVIMTRQVAFPAVDSR